MKILHTVEFYTPSVGGMQEVVRRLSEGLAAKGHDVTVATTRLSERAEAVINGVKIEEFEVSGNLVRGMVGETDRYASFLAETKFDVVVNFAAQQWASDIALLNLDKIKAKKVFVPTGFPGINSWEYEGYFEKMKSWMSLYDMNVFLSDDYRDVNFAKKNGIKKRVLIPNGAGKAEFSRPVIDDIRARLDIPENHLLILHVGSHTGVKGHREAMAIFKRAKIRDATLLIIGNRFGAGGCSLSCFGKSRLYSGSFFRRYDNKRIINVEMSRPETVAAYHAADLFLFPSNIECSPIVLFEAMASRTPFLTSEAGNAKEIVGWSRGGIVLPTKSVKGGFGQCYVDVRKSTKILERLCADAGRRRSLGERGFRAWQSRFTWESIINDYEQLYRGLIQNDYDSHSDNRRAGQPDVSVRRRATVGA